MAVLLLDALAADILRRDAVDGVRIVGVDGPSGSGKSTFAQRLAVALGAPVVEVDDFLSWDDLHGWWPRFEAQVLTPLFTGHDARFQVRDWEKDELGTSLNGWKTVNWASSVVIEGVTCTRRAVASRLAYRVWVDAPEPLRLHRGIQRDGESHRQLWEHFMRSETDFFANDDTRARADLRVDGAPDLPHKPSTEIVIVT